MRTAIELMLIGAGGAIGAMSRFGIAEFSRRMFSNSFPIGTLLANLAGCFLIGVLLGSGQADKSEPLRLGVGVGFLGALTTFSTFGAETIQKVNDGNWGVAFGNIAANLVLGLGLVALGILAGKKFDCLIRWVRPVARMSKL